MASLAAALLVFLVAAFAVLSYLPLRTHDRQALAGKTLWHFTSDAGARATTAGTSGGTVTLAPPAGGLRGALRCVVQWSHGIRDLRPTTYIYTQNPSRLERKFHHSSTPTFLVEIAGADLLAAHPGRMYRSLWGHALALPAGYTGPGTVTTISGWPPPP